MQSRLLMVGGAFLLSVASALLKTKANQIRFDECVEAAVDKRLKDLEENIEEENE